MFCPHCGSENQADQNFCRFCGLRLEAVSRELMTQAPSKQLAALQRRNALFGKLGLMSLSVSGLIGISLIFGAAAYYKLILFGPEVLFWSAAGALIGFLLLSAFFFSFPKLFLKPKGKNTGQAEDPIPAAPRNNLIDERPFEPVPSVTEDSTDLLLEPRKSRSSK
jgi:hypothetical protein